MQRICPRFPNSLLEIHKNDHIIYKLNATEAKLLNFAKLLKMRKYTYIDIFIVKVSVLKIVRSTTLCLGVVAFRNEDSGVCLRTGRGNLLLILACSTSKKNRN